jgi:hypothetical protein
LPKGKNSTTTSTKEQWKFLQMIPMWNTCISVHNEKYIK